MFTDMVGYSALAQRDEALALDLLEEHREIIRGILPRFNGTEIKTIGDAFLVEFHSALEAAQCAIEIQRILAKRNHDVPSERRIEIRVGIHIGDLEQIESARKFDPLSVRISFDVGVKFWFERQFEMAANQLEQTVSMDPSNSLAYDFLGQILWKLNKSAEAFSAFDKTNTLNGVF